MAHDKSRGIKSLGIAAVPTPINVPSQRKENRGKESFLPTPIPSNESQKVWGQSNGEQTASSKSDNPAAPAPAVSSSPRPSPWNIPKPSHGSEAAPKQVSMPRWAEAESDDDEEEVVPEVGLSLDFLTDSCSRVSHPPHRIPPTLMLLVPESHFSIVGVKPIDHHSLPRRGGEEADPMCDSSVPLKSILL